MSDAVHHLFGAPKDFPDGDAVAAELDEIATEAFGEAEHDANGLVTYAAEYTPGAQVRTEGRKDVDHLLWCGSGKLSKFTVRLHRVKPAKDGKWRPAELLGIRLDVSSKLKPTREDEPADTFENQVPERVHPLHRRVFGNGR